MGAQRRSEHELADRAREPVHNLNICCYRKGVTNMIFVPREKGVEREAGDKDAVYELGDAGEDEEDEKSVDEFQAGRCRVEVRGPEGLQGERRRRGRRRFCVGRSVFSGARR